ncbi:MAG: glycosyltransferase [Clostridia bacterium]|nr:glycosyltransferase [Clostridia bacterium]
MKQKMLIIGITMAAAGSEKSFLSFARHAIDYDQYEVDLLLAKKTGDFLSQIPKNIRVLEMGKEGEIFLINRDNAARIIARRYLLKNPLRAFSLLPHIIKRKTAKTAAEKDFASNRMWCELLKKMPAWDTEYDVALAYWGDHTMFYMCDKVKAKKKIAWLHFDYANPPREDALYLHYFSKCDKVVTVSKKIEASLKQALPEIADKVMTMENIIDAEDILQRASEPCDLADDFQGIRLLTVGRICHQKGYDMAIPAIARLISEKHDIKWYIIGDGEAIDKENLHARIRQYGLQDRVSFLGIRQNPYPYMKACDIYLQPSRHEGKPIAVEEAKILQKPIVVTDYSSAREQMAGYPIYEIAEISEDGIYGGLQTMLKRIGIV